MSKSVSNAKTTKVQKLCTLWTHDDNFSRDDIVFNEDKFPELPTKPGTLLQIIPVTSSISVRDFQATRNTEHVPPHVRTDVTARDSRVSIPGRSRRGSITITIDENGTTTAGGRDLDSDKAYVFAASTISADLKSKHANLQVSISERIAKVFGFRNRMQVIVAEVSAAQMTTTHR